MKLFVQRQLSKYGLKVGRTNPIPFDAEQRFKEHYETIKPHTMVSAERCYLVYQLVQHVVRNDISGAIVECGVWRGGVCMLAALTLRDLGDTRDIYLFDTFSGMAQPGEKDITTDGRAAGADYTGKHAVSVEIVREHMASTGYENFHLVPGMVEDTLPGEAPEEIALLRLDTDWYASTLHELETMFPRVSKSGAVIIDDYAKWDGAKKAVHEYLHKESLNHVLFRISGNRVIFK